MVAQICQGAPTHRVARLVDVNRSLLPYRSKHGLLPTEQEHIPIVRCSSDTVTPLQKIPQISVAAHLVPAGLKLWDGYL